MSLVLACLFLFSSPAGPQVYYYNGKSLTKLGVIEEPNIGRAAVTLFIHSPYELINARIDSDEVQMCLPEVPLRNHFKLSGRWYVVVWKTKLTVGGTDHVLCMTSYKGKVHERRFTVDVEGAKRLEKPPGVGK